MATIHGTWRLNAKNLGQCCVFALEYEMYVRGDAGTSLMKEGEVFECGQCGKEMACNSDGPSGKLRWRFNEKRS